MARQFDDDLENAEIVNRETLLSISDMLSEDSESYVNGFVNVSCSEALQVLQNLLVHGFLVVL